MIEDKALYKQEKLSTTEIYPQALINRNILFYFSKYSDVSQNKGVKSILQCKILQ